MWKERNGSFSTHRTFIPSPGLDYIDGRGYMSNGVGIDTRIDFGPPRDYNNSIVTPAPNGRLEKMNKKSQIGDDFLNRTTIHGLIDIFKAKTIASRIFWGIVLLANAVFLIYNVVKTSMDFSNVPLVTRVKIRLIEEFPDVMVCPMGIVGTPEVFKKYNLTAEDIVYMNGFFFTSRTNLESISDQLDTARLKTKLMKLLEENALSLPELLMDIAGSVDVREKFGFTHLLGNSSEPELPYVVNENGLCFKLKIKQKVRDGHFPAQTQIIIPSFFNMMPKERGLNKAYTYLVVFFGNETNSYFPRMATYFPDGSRSFLELKETKGAYMNNAREPCDLRESHEIANTVIKCYNSQVTNCKYMTTPDLLIRPNATMNRTDEYCNILSDNWFNPGVFRKCVESETGVSIPCRQTHYEVTTRDVPSGGNTTFVVMSYRFVSGMVIEEHEMYTWQIFFSNIGGLLSLLCGASTISLFQVIFYLVKTAFYHPKQQFNKRSASFRRTPSYMYRNYV